MLCLCQFPDLSNYSVQDNNMRKNGVKITHNNFVQFYIISLNFKLFERGQTHTFTNFQNRFQYSKVIQTFACDSILAHYLSVDNVFLALFFSLSWTCCQRRTQHLT